MKLDGFTIPNKFFWRVCGRIGGIGETRRES